MSGSQILSQMNNNYEFLVKSHPQNSALINTKYLLSLLLTNMLILLLNPVSYVCLFTLVYGYWVFSKNQQ